MMGKRTEHGFQKKPNVIGEMKIKSTASTPLTLVRIERPMTKNTSENVGKEKTLFTVGGNLN